MWLIIFSLLPDDIVDVENRRCLSCWVCALGSGHDAAEVVTLGATHWTPTHLHDPDPSYLTHSSLILLIFIKYLQRMGTKYKKLLEAGANYLSAISQKFSFNKQAFKMQKHCKVIWSLSLVELSTWQWKT